MTNLRKYGKPPYRVALVHGGPGAGGDMAPLARELESDYGVLEPIQTLDSLEGQIIELRNILNNNGDLPIVLVGFSWGAWLSSIIASLYPELVQKLILIGSAPFEEKYVHIIIETMNGRLNEEKELKLKEITGKFYNPEIKDKNHLLAQYGEIYSEANAFDPIPTITEIVEYRFDIFSKVWSAASQLRRNNRLLDLVETIECPVVAIHGDYDSHPAEGVQVPLSGILKNFDFHLLENCGHKPWIERQAKDTFYKLIKKEI